MSGSECSVARLAMPGNAEFTRVNEQFPGEHNAANEHYGQTLINSDPGFSGNVKST